MVGDAVCLDRGTEMAYWLFWQMKTVGVFMTPAKFMASWKSPSDVAPSPRKVTVAMLSFLMLAAHAAPTAWSVCVATGTETGKLLSPFGMALPFSLPMKTRKKRCAGIPLMMKTPVSLKEGKSQSVGFMASPTPAWASCPVACAKVPILPDRWSARALVSRTRVVIIAS